MKAFIASVVVLIVVAVAAGFILDGINKNAESAYTTQSARPN